MSGIVLSSSVRQNLLSLQSTADLLATTQSRLSTGKKVNTALDNPTNYFTAASLDSRASDINNLLDGIGNGVQVLQSANTGITSLQKLVDSAKSVANQALQTTVGFSTKSAFTSVDIAGATADNLVADQDPTNAAFTGTSAPQRAAYTSTAATAGTQLYSGNATNASASTLLSALTTNAGVGGAANAIQANDTLTVNGKTITFGAGANGLVGSGTAYTMGVDTSLSDLMTAIDTLSGNTTPANASTATSGIITLRSGTAADLVVTGSASVLDKLAIDGAGASTATRGGGAVTAGALAGATKLSVGDGTAASLSNAFAVGDTLTVNGKTLSFVAANTIGNDPNQIKIDSDVTGLLAKIDGLTGSSTASTITGGVITLNTGTLSDLTLTSSNAAALSAIGLAGGVTQARTEVPGVLEGKTLKIGATGGGTATDIVFGTGAGRVSSLNGLNDALAANNLQATFVSGKLTITTTNEAASATIGAITGSAVGAGQAFAAGTTAPAPVVDAAAKLTRDNLVTQYNNIINQITTTAQDASFNGVNLLGGDTLKLTFNETGKSTLSIQGVNFNPAGLGLDVLTTGAFKDNAAINEIVTSLNGASSTLRSQASAFGSNLSIVQIRQDFNKNLINVLQTGSSNLTLADTNEEAANSQALSTRQSIAVSALALANQSQQSVLQLLR
ncbi:flagellar hook protein [Bradyrhizobium sp. AUGA SZCCT0240]|uniref:flagellin N-terminal helical domain-containing protein n=2 Tax=unclassified Bradyrhizobium TaxID=2631580 RepID=UPI001BA461A6|nr:flagellin [Bradyrhizobium sp. AUGA SZCCT0240]MBR1256642.1 flagellar hook protein [Bradyrhizobium sp. AUGA SZCCT0240]